MSSSSDKFVLMMWPRCEYDLTHDLWVYRLDLGICNTIVLAHNKQGRHAVKTFGAELLISIIAIESDTIERYFCSIAIGIADTFMRKYRYRYRRYFFRLYRYRLSAILWSIAVDY
jgi:hypothetical protein